MKYRKGFTLVELLATIAIIGILGSSVTAAVGMSREKARDARRLSAVSEMQKALELYYETHHTYPTTTPAGFGGADAALQMLHAAGYLKSDPSQSGNAYAYFGGVGNQSPIADCSTGWCQGYSLSVLLERDDAATLASDSDARVDDALGSALFEGNSADCGASVSGPERCLDVTPLQIRH